MIKSVAVRRALTAALCLMLVLAVDLGVHAPAVATTMARLHLHAPQALEHLFWDAEPYADGIARALAGKSPYRLDDPGNLLPFAYPPAFVWVGAGLARLLPSPWGRRAYVAVYVVSVFLLQMVLAGVLLVRLGRRQVLPLLALAPLGLFLSTVFLSGNIHVLWYAAAVLAAWPGLRRGRWWVFHAVTFAAAVNQPVFVLLLLFPVFLAPRRAWVSKAAVAVAAALAYVSQRLIDPELFRTFQATIALHLAATHDYGQGIFGIAAGLLDPHNRHGIVLPALVQATFSGAIVLLLLWLRPAVHARERRWWALLALAIVLVNPRIMPYDASLGLIPALFFLCSGRLTWRRWTVIAAALAGSIALHRLTGLTLVLAGGFAVGAWQLVLERQRRTNLRAESQTRPAAEALST